jgi:hypothetical protein
LRHQSDVAKNANKTQSSPDFALSGKLQINSVQFSQWHDACVVPKASFAPQFFPGIRAMLLEHYLVVIGFTGFVSVMLTTMRPLKRLDPFWV